MDNVKEKMDIFFDKTAPSIVVNIAEYRDGYKGIRKRGGKIRAFTEITKENVNHCRELMKLVDELRHLEGVRGGVAVSEKEYMATTVLQENNPLTQVIYSNVKEVVEQGQYIFDTLWKNAIPAEHKIKEIEQGIEPIKTEVLRNTEEIQNRFTEFVNQSDELCICSSMEGVQMTYNSSFKLFENVLEKYRKGQHKGIRWITSINNLEDTHIVEMFLNSGIKIGHIKDVPFINFGLSNRLFISAIEKLEEGAEVNNLFSSNDIVYLYHFRQQFEKLWKSSIDATKRITEIGKDNNITVDVLLNPKESIPLVYELLYSAKKEILILLSSTKAFIRAENADIFKLFDQLEDNGKKVKILIPLDKGESFPADKLKTNYKNIEIRVLQSPLPSKIDIVTFDKQKTLIFEVKDDSAQSVVDAIGLAIYIQGKSTSLSYGAIFDSLWTQTEMYEQLQIHDRMQKDFINNAAHELRTPIQPIIGLSELVKKEINDERHKEFLDIISRNAKRLQHLSEDILDVTKIDNKIFTLNKEYFRVKEMISNTLTDYQDNTNNKIVKFIYQIPEDFVIHGDRNRISQVIYNLIDNAQKFSPPNSLITIIVEKVTSTLENRAEMAVIHIKDDGAGIEPGISQRLFTKFATASFQGIGLGLFISKKIVEAHGGRIWAQNNKEGKGATFSFSLPIYQR